MLQRFYGFIGQPWEHTPIAIIDAYLTMLPRLQAREVLTGSAMLDMSLPPLPMPQSRQEQTAWREHFRQVDRARRQLNEQAGYGAIQRRERAKRARPVNYENLAALGFEVEVR